MYVGPWQEFNLMRALYGGRPVRAPPREELLEHHHRAIQDQFDVGVAGSVAGSDAATSQQQNVYNPQQFMAQPQTSRTTASGTSQNSGTRRPSAGHRSYHEQQQQQQQHVRLRPLASESQDHHPHHQHRHRQQQQQQQWRQAGPASDPGRPSDRGPQALTALLRTSRTTDEELQNFVQHGNRFVPPVTNTSRSSQQQSSGGKPEKKFLTQKSADPTDRQRRREMLTKLYAHEQQQQQHQDADLTSAPQSHSRQGRRSASPQDARGGRPGSSSSSPGQQQQHQTRNNNVSSSIQDFAGVFSSPSQQQQQHGLLSQRRMSLHLPPIPDPAAAQARAQFVGREIMQDLLPLPHHHHHNAEQNAQKFQQLPRMPSPDAQQQQQQQQQVGLKTTAGLINANVFSLLKRTGGGPQQPQLPFDIPTLTEHSSNSHHHHHHHSDLARSSGVQRSFDVGAPVLMPSKTASGETAQGQMSRAVVPLHRQEAQQHIKQRRTPAPPLQVSGPGSNPRFATVGHRHPQLQNNSIDTGAPVLVPPTLYDDATRQLRTDELTLDEKRRNLVAQHEKLQEIYVRDQQRGVLETHQNVQRQNLHLQLGSAENAVRQAYSNRAQYEQQHHHHHTGDARSGLYSGNEGRRLPSPLDVNSLQEITSALQQQQQQNHHHSPPASRPLSGISSRGGGGAGAAAAVGARESSLSPMSTSFGMNSQVGDLLKWAKDLPSTSALF